MVSAPLALRPARLYSRDAITVGGIRRLASPLHEPEGFSAARGTIEFAGLLQPHLEHSRRDGVSNQLFAEQPGQDGSTNRRATVSPDMSARDSSARYMASEIAGGMETSPF